MNRKIIQNAQGCVTRGNFVLQLATQIWVKKTLQVRIPEGL